MTRIGELNGIIKPSVPYLEMMVANTDVVVDDAWNQIYWDTILYQTSDFTVLHQSTPTHMDEIRIETTGMYLIDLRLSFYFDAQDILYTRITINDEELLGSRGYAHAAVSADAAIIQTSKMAYLKKGDIVHIEWMVSYDTGGHNANLCDYGEIITGTSVVRFSYIPMGGFNNKNCGNIINRGIRR